MAIASPIPPPDDGGLAPPWKAVPPARDGDAWTVATDRGHPADELDLLANAPEWFARLIVRMPRVVDELIRLESTLRLWSRSADATINAAALERLAARLRSALEDPDAPRP